MGYLMKNEFNKGWHFLLIVEVVSNIYLPLFLKVLKENILVNLKINSIILNLKSKINRRIFLLIYLSKFIS